MVRGLADCTHLTENCLPGPGPTQGSLLHRELLLSARSWSMTSSTLAGTLQKLAVAQALLSVTVSGVIHQKAYRKKAKGKSCVNNAVLLLTVLGGLTRQMVHSCNIYVPLSCPILPCQEASSSSVVSFHQLAPYFTGVTCNSYPLSKLILQLSCLLGETTATGAAEGGFPLAVTNSCIPSSLWLLPLLSLFLRRTEMVA